LDLHFATQVLPLLQLRRVGAVQVIEESDLAFDPAFSLYSVAPFASFGEAVEVGLELGGRVIGEVGEGGEPSRDIR
jgi:hypothetical protein